MTPIFSIIKEVIDWIFSIGTWITCHNAIINAIATVFIAGFTWALYWATNKLWQVSKETADAANKSAKVAEDALISGKRAFVFVKHIISNKKSITQEIDNWDIVIVWKNTGNTPTKNLVCSANFEGFKENIPDDFDFPASLKYQPLRAVIGPGGEITHTITIPLQHLYINSPPPNKVYVWGWANYNDVFKDTQRHRTEFCFKIEQVGRGNSTTLSFNLHTKYNGADDECYHQPAPYTPET
jgi:hypothetical protein